MKANVLILFEILEFNTELVARGSNLLTPDNLYPIAWSYLRPLGASSIHMDRVKLQLYRYRYKADKASKMNRPFDPRIPDVLLELNWQRKIKFNSYLEVELQFCNRINHQIERKHFSRAPWEKEVGLFRYNSSKQQMIKQNTTQIQEDEDLNVVKRLRKWEKF